MRMRLVATVAVLAASLGVAGSVAGPVYAAFGGSSTGTTTTAGPALPGTMGRIMR